MDILLSAVLVVGMTANAVPMYVLAQENVEEKDKVVDTIFNGRDLPGSPDADVTGNPAGNPDADATGNLTGDSDVTGDLTEDLDENSTDNPTELPTDMMRMRLEHWNWQAMTGRCPVRQRQRIRMTIRK